MEKKTEPKPSLCPLCLEPVNPDTQKTVIVWGKPSHFRCATRAQAKFQPYEPGSGKPVAEQVKATGSPPAKREA